MTHPTRRRITITLTALTTTVLLTACSGGADPAAEDTGSVATERSAAEEVDEDGAHNDADTQFAQMMIVHHEGAIEMADLVVERGGTEEVRALGERIAAAQGPEIDLMSGWLAAWGEDMPGEAQHGAMDHAGMDMEGMDQGEAMTELEGLEGMELDRRFLELMIAHHRGAIEMAETHLADGENPDARELAGKVIDDQAREITEMRGLLDDL
ncbi:DUF305 domain-containing protein [Actinotalea sp. C106]|uniref:DUF305 domain-containing protein n=1 Tax=Actinotalea sp. C106 TaxID=2908644 RepID=UPI0020293F93|nr:DUF305 domain-containing protein [Actinotalea sp. C106]